MKEITMNETMLLIDALQFVLDTEASNMYSVIANMSMETLEDIEDIEDTFKTWIDRLVTFEKLTRGTSKEYLYAVYNKRFTVCRFKCFEALRRLCG